MSDFYQTGGVTTLHRLSADGLTRVESELRRYARARPVGLVLPALYSEFETPAMQRIVDQLAGVDYLQRIVVAVGRASREQFDHARSFFRDFPTPVTVIWVDSEPDPSAFRNARRARTVGGGRRQGPFLLAGLRIPAGDAAIAR